MKQMDGKGFTHIFHLRFDAPPPMLSDQVCVPQVGNPPVRPSLGPSHRFFGGALQLSYMRQSTKGGHFIWVGGSFPPLFSSCTDNRSGRRREGREFRTGKEGVGRLSPFLSAYVASPPPLRLPGYQIGSVAMASPPSPPHLTGSSPVHIPYARASLLHLLLVFFSSAAKLSGGGGGGGGAYRPARPPDFAPRSTLRPGMRRRRPWRFGERGEGECPTASNCPSVHTISVFV